MTLSLSEFVTYFQMMMTLSLSEPFVLMLTVISCGLAENKSLVSHFFCPKVTDFNSRNSMP
jgi:hypothetical protein